MGDNSNAYQMLTSTPKGRRPLGRHIWRRDNNVRMSFKAAGVNVRNWIGYFEDRD